MKPSVPTIEVILPVFNEEKNLPSLLEKLEKVSETLSGQASLQLLFINDGSSDNTADILNTYKGPLPTQVVHLVHNFGHASALACGVGHFDADIAVFLDADGQDDPTAITEMFSHWEKGAQTVVAERGERKERNRWLFHGFYFLFHRFVKSMPPVRFGTYCLLDRIVVERLKTFQETHRYFPGLVAFASGKIATVKVNRQARQHGHSRVGLFGLVQLATTAFLSFSSTPIRMVSLLGVLASIIALFLGTSIVAIKLFTDRAIPGWASIMTATAFGSGIQLLCLGLIGEYLARIYDEVKGRPLYIVDHIGQRNSTPTRLAPRKSA